jgi:hypothetical protein
MIFPKVLLVVHGDAAIAGQGILYEIANGYSGGLQNRWDEFISLM